MEQYPGPEPINIGTGSDISIFELAVMLAKISGFKGAILWDRSKPDGTMLKRLDVSRAAALGWHHTIELEDGLRETWKQKGEAK
jgi:GDP-L-fucose synthase